MQADATKTKLLTTGEAAAVLGVTKATLDCWRSSGRYSLPFVRIGSLVKYRTVDLERFIEANTVKPCEVSA